MITLIGAIAVGLGGWAVTYYVADFGLGWSIFCGLVCFGIVQGVVGYFIRKRVMFDMQCIQAILAEGQKSLQAKTARWQFRPPGSIQEAQREIFNDTKSFVLAALAQTELLRKYRLWVPMIDRQMATAQLQLNWMIKDFAAVDRLMPKALLIDPTMAAIKMARMYMLEKPTEDIGKVYAKAVRRVRYNQNVLLAATWSWILVRRGKLDEAFAALTDALKNSDNETLKRNHQALMNNRPAHFNNSGIGDTWYSLLLEEPKIRMQRPRNVWR